MGQPIIFFSQKTRLADPALGKHLQQLQIYFLIETVLTLNFESLI